MLKFENVTFAYQPGDAVLRNISVTASPGEVLLILGHNGAGKSTFLKLLNSILKPTSGNVFVKGKDTRSHSTSILAQDVSVTFQNPRDQIFASTVEEEIAFGPRILNRTNGTELAARASELFGFAKELTLHPYDLPPSRQKLLTGACAVASGTSLLAFDEPSAGLSIPERHTLINALQQVQENKLLLIVSHELDVFLPLATRVLVFHQGELVSDVSPNLVTTDEKMLRAVSLKLPLSLRLQKLFAASLQ